MKSLRLSWLLWSALLFFVLVGAPRPAASNVLPNYWTGAISNDWSIGGNWTYGTAPDSYSVNNEIDSVDQNTGLPLPLPYGFPVIGTSGPASADNLTVSGSAVPLLYSTLTLADSATLSLAGAPGNGGTIHGNLWVENNGILTLGSNANLSVASNLYVQNTGTLTLGSLANVSLAGNLYFDAGSTYTSGPGATITLTGSYVIINSNNVHMSNTTLSFTNPTASDVLDVEVAGFTLGTLTLAGSGAVTLEGNNLTVGTLNVEGNSILYLNSLNIDATATNLSGNGKILFGDPPGGAPPVPLPGSAWLLLSGLGGLAGWRRLRKS
jgi:hypothetical protein